jgi:hypothetical protein
MSMIWLIYYRQKSNSYDNSLIKNWDWLKTLFLKLTFTSAINPPKMSPKRTEWDTSQSAPESLKKKKKLINILVTT